MSEVVHDDPESVEEVTREMLGLFESFTDEEYKESKCLSYSILKDVYDNPEVLTKERKSEEKEWLTFGTLVDIMLTTPEDIEKRVFVNNKVPSEQFVKAANYIIDNDLLPNKLVSDISMMTTAQIADIYTKSGSLSRYTPEVKMEKLINECGDYIELLTIHKDKIIISTETFNEAAQIAEVLKTHRWTKNLFMSKKDQEKNNIELYYQYKIKYVYEGIQCKSKIDIVKVDHDRRTIFLCDIKTGSDFPKAFIKNSIYKYRYLYQGALYKEGMEIFTQKIPSLKDYNIDAFRFMYVNRLRPTYPVILKMDSICHQEIINFGVETSLYDLPSLKDIFKATSFYIKQIDEGKTPVEPYYLQSSNGEVTLSGSNNYVF